MTLSQDETKQFVKLVLKSEKSIARNVLFIALQNLGHSEAEFYAGVIEHRSGLNLTTNDWFELLCRLPNRLLRSQLNLDGILSEEALKKLPPVTG